MAAKIKKGDQVVVCAGRSKGVTGEVLRVLPKDKLIVAGVNLIKKHVKPNPEANNSGGIVEKEGTIHRSNVKLQEGKVGFKFLADGRKVRYFKKNNELVDAK